MTKTLGPYSVTKKAGQLLFISGQVGIDQTNRNVPGTIVGQTRIVLQNIKSIVESEKLSMQHIVKTTVYLSNMDDFAMMNNEYEKHFMPPRPARSTVAVKELPRVGGNVPILVEIEAIASKGKK
jgi:2-iminobutanoate/2-iminopropanoate deaminase